MSLHHIVFKAVSPKLAAVGLSLAFATASAAHAQAKEGCIRAETPAPGHLLAQSAPGVIDLGRGPRSVRMEPVCTADGRTIGLAQRVGAAPARRRFILVIEDLRAEAQPGVLFDLKLGDDDGPHDEGGALLGTLNFYAAQRPGVAARPRMVSYDVTETLRTLAASGRLAGGLILAIQPVAAPAPGSDATIGRIALVEQ